IEEGKNLNVYDASVIKRFERASAKAKGALSAAETFLPFCDKEPRIKGSFDELSNIYSEVDLPITERMDNMLQLRTAYGSGPLEELNAQVYPYRRNVAGSIILTLSAVHGALIHKLPLPQFLPSARLAHLRMVNRVREAVQENIDQGEYQHEAGELTRHRLVRRKYMSWNASSAAQAEVIEYLEELIDLTKLLVGANEFRSGLLVRPTYLEYAEKIFQENTNEEIEPAIDTDGAHESGDAFNEPPTQISSMTRRRRGTTLKSAGSEGDELPTSLRRIQSRKVEAGIKRQATRDDWNR
ncbi:MAG: hypothetical protein Q9214_004240, partial [Letrouitia sp. 1 TL-2023]